MGEIQTMAMIQLVDDTDYTPTLDTEHRQYLLGDQTTPSTPIYAMPAEQKTAKEVSQYEIWHQRMGHAPAPRLHQTAKHVQGLPQINAQKIPPFVRCRACDIAKLRKAPKGHTLSDPLTLHNGQCFHMDIGFLRGPAVEPASCGRPQRGRTAQGHKQPTQLRLLLTRCGPQIKIHVGVSPPVAIGPYGTHGDLPENPR